MAEEFKFKNFVELPVILDLKDKEGNVTKNLSYNMMANINSISYCRPGILNEELSEEFTMVAVGSREFPVMLSYGQVRKLIVGITATVNIDGSTREPWMGDDDQ